MGRKPTEVVQVQMQFTRSVHTGMNCQNEFDLGYPTVLCSNPGPGTLSRQFRKPGTIYQNLQKMQSNRNTPLTAVNWINTWCLIETCYMPLPCYITLFAWLNGIKQFSCCSLHWGWSHNIRDLRFLHHPNLSSHLVLQRLCSEAALSPGTWCILVLHFGLNMVLRWPYVILSMEQSMNNYFIKVCFTYNTYLLMTFWLLLHRKNNIATLWRTLRIIVSG